MLEACVDLACDVDMVAVARHFVGQTLLLWEVDPEHVDDAMLLTSELMSNAIDVHVAALRRKLGAELIQTRRGLGYLIDG